MSAENPCGCGGTVKVSTRGQRGPAGIACYRIVTAVATVPNTYVSNNNVNITQYDNNTIYEVILQTSNIAGAATLNINSLGALPLQKGEIGSEHNMLADEIQAGEMIRVLLENNIFLVVQRHAEEMRFSNMLYVDAVYGNNTYAEVDNKEKPYATIAAAQSAAASGDTIYILPGTYTENGLGKSGVNYHFMNGAILAATTGNGFIDTAAISYSISGDGELTCTTGKVANFTNGGTLSLTAKRSTNTTGSNLQATSTSKIYATFTQDVTATNGVNFSLANSGEIHVIAALVSSAGAAGTCGLSASATSTLNIRASKITASGLTVFDLAGNANIYGKISYTGVGSAIQCSAAVACNQNFYGDIDSSSAALILQYNFANTGTISFYGKIVSTGQITLAASLATYDFYNEITTNNGNVPSINMTTGTVKVMSRITNLNAGAAAYCITKTAGTLVLQNAILVTSGATECVHSVAAQNMVVYNSVANIAVSANITQRVSSVMIDAQVV